MLPSEEFGLVPKFGLEIEVPSWNRTRKAVCLELIQAGHMTKHGKFENEFHKYHCDCAVCARWLGGKIPWPIQTILQYDASLPDTGGEFITSPMLCTGLFLDSLERVWETICRDAQWTNKVPNRRGNATSPSVHIHVSVDNPYIPRSDPHGGRSALWGYMPELFTLAGVSIGNRGLEYCSVDENDGGRHSAINVVNVRPIENFLQEYDDVGDDDIEEPRFDAHVPPIQVDQFWTTAINTTATIAPLTERQMREGAARQRGRAPANMNGSALRYEWRMWEAAYKDWSYIKGAIAVSCALTQLASNKSAMKMLATGADLMDDPFNGQDRGIAPLLKQFSKKRFTFLKDTIMSAPLLTEDRDVFIAADEFLSRIQGG